MAFITFFGAGGVMLNAPDFTGLFTDPVISSSPTERVIGFTPTSLNYIYTITGTDFTYDAGGDFSGGVITGLSGTDSDVLNFTVTGLSIAALTAQSLFEASDDQGFLDLLIAGDDNINGSNGADYLTGGAGFDFVFGNEGDDTLDGGAEDDFLTGGAGADLILGGAGTDFANYGGSDAINIDLMMNLASGGHAEGDTLTSIESVIAGPGNDTLRGDDGDNYFNGAAGDDTIEGRGGADNIEAGDGGDTVDSGDGGDLIDGEGGADSLRGGAGDDRLNGDSSPDTIQGGLGADTLDGGTALDTLDYTDKTGGVNVNVINGVALTGGFVNSAGFYQGGAQEDVISNFENINGSEFADRLIAGSTSARIEGRGGNDYLFTFSGNDTIFGGAGNDFISTAKSSDMLNGEAGNDTLNGGADRDTADYSDRTGAVSVNLGSGTAITGGMLNASSFYTGGFTEDSLVSIENVTGSAFGDRLVGSGAGSNIVGGGGGDSIASFSGADTIIGGDGNDTATGGAGNDRFFFSVGHDADRITDFSAGAAVGDVIKFFGFGTALDSFAEVIAASAQVGADVVITLGGGDQITLAGVTLANLNANDFEFG